MFPPIVHTYESWFCVTRVQIAGRWRGTTGSAFGSVFGDDHGDAVDRDLPGLGAGPVHISKSRGSGAASSGASAPGARAPSPRPRSAPARCSCCPHRTPSHCCCRSCWILLSCLLSYQRLVQPGLPRRCACTITKRLKR